MSTERFVLITETSLAVTMKLPEHYEQNYFFSEFDTDKGYDHANQSYKF